MWRHQRLAILHQAVVVHGMTITLVLAVHLHVALVGMTIALVSLAQAGLVLVAVILVGLAQAILALVGIAVQVLAQATGNHGTSRSFNWNWSSMRDGSSCSYRILGW
jgi:hypothetical protein